MLCIWMNTYQMWQCARLSDCQWWFGVLLRIYFALNVIEPKNLRTWSCQQVVWHVKVKLAGWSYVWLCQTAHGSRPVICNHGKLEPVHAISCQKPMERQILNVHTKIEWRLTQTWRWLRPCRVMIEIHWKRRNRAYYRQASLSSVMKFFIESGSDDNLKRELGGSWK